MIDKESVSITEDEAELYDRQIRLWGLDAQKRLRAARVLLIGGTGLGAEVAKNIVLAGIKALTLLDHDQVTDEDFANQFLVTREDNGKNRAKSSLIRTQLLNPMVEVSADQSSVQSKEDEFFLDFDVICATGCSQEEIIRINDICHANNIMFFAGDVFGFYGYMFADLNQHEYAEEIQKNVKTCDNTSGEPVPKKAKHHTETVTVKKSCHFTRFKAALDVNWIAEDKLKILKKTPDTYFIIRVLLEFRSKHGRSPSTKHQQSDIEELHLLRQHVIGVLGIDAALIPEEFTEYCFSSLSPVCAVTGGILGQEIIKAVSQKDTPHNNFFFYNGVSGNGIVDRIGA